MWTLVLALVLVGQGHDPGFVSGRVYAYDAANGVAIVRVHLPARSVQYVQIDEYFRDHLKRQLAAEGCIAWIWYVPSGEGLDRKGRKTVAGDQMGCWAYHRSFVPGVDYGR